MKDANTTDSLLTILVNLVVFLVSLAKWYQGRHGND